MGIPIFVSFLVITTARRIQKGESLAQFYYSLGSGTPKFAGNLDTEINFCHSRNDND